MLAWLRQHRQAVALAANKLAAQPLTTVLNALVIGVALALPAGGYTLIASLASVTRQMTPDPQLSVFLQDSATRAQADALGARLKADARIAALRFVPKDEALKSLRATEGLAEVVDALGRNPLPDAFVLRPSESAPEALEAFAAELRGQPGVAQVQLDSAWVRRLAAIALTGRIATGVLAALLAAGLVAVTFNSIRLQILTHAEEISVSRLIGATDAYIARPFYYLGGLQGALGGLVALGILAGSLALLNVGVRELAEAYGSPFRLGFLAPRDAASVVAFAALLGWLGASLSVSVHLRRIP